MENNKPVNLASALLPSTLEPVDTALTASEEAQRQVIESTRFPDSRLDLISAPLPFELFSARLTNSLHNSNINTIGQLFDMIYDDRDSRGVGLGTRSEIDRVLEAIAMEVGVASFWQTLPIGLSMPVPRQIKSNYSLLPDEELESIFTGVPVLPVLLELEVKSLFQDVKSTKYQVLVRRVGLDGSHVYTIEDIATLYKISIQRVRQIERDAIIRFKRFIFNGNVEELNSFFHPLVSKRTIFLHRIAEVLCFFDLQ